MDSTASSTGTGCTDLGVLPSTLDDGVARRAAIGLVVLATDQTMEHEFRQSVRQDGVAFYESRLFYDNELTPETLRAMQSRIASAASLLLPGFLLNLMAFGFTASSLELVEHTLLAALRKARPHALYTPRHSTDSRRVRN